MKAIIFILPLLITSICHAQDTLSANDYNHLSYKLNPDINTTDPASIAASFNSIAQKIFNDTKRFTENPLRDSGMLKDVYYTLVYGALYQNDYTTALKYISKARELTYIKKYTTPPFLLAKGYAEARLNSNDRSSFNRVFEQSLKKDFKLIDPDFLKDVANQLKGAYDLQRAAINRKDVEKNLSEVLHTDSSIVMYNMPWLMELLFQANVITDQQQLIQHLLKDLSPEHVTMQPVKIPMRDGINLGGFVFRNDATTEKMPAIISQSPYPQGNESSQGNIFAVNGYVYLYVDCRGRRSSEGEFFPYENDARDFYDIIEWASKQPWCNGKVATTGGSYLGFTQWQAIRSEYRHPALKAINPMAAVGFGVDFPRNHQTFDMYSLRWAMDVQGRELNDALFFNISFWANKGYQQYKNHIPFSKFDSVVGVKNLFFTKWVHHPDFDNYWKNILPKKEDYQQLEIPVLTTTGYYDADQLGALYYYKNHIHFKPGNRHYMIIGPFDHGGSQWMPAAIKDEAEAQIPLYKYVIQWFDWALKGKQLPAFFKDKINYYVLGEHSWKSAPTLQAITKDSLKFYITSKTVSYKYPMWQIQKSFNSKDTAFTYRHDINSTMDSLEIFSPGSIKNMDSVEYTFNSGLAFETVPLENDIILSGSIAAHLFASLNVPDADVEVSFNEVDSADNEKLLAQDVLRTRYRNSPEDPQLMVPGKPYLLHFNTSFFKVKKIRKGQRLRFYVSIRNNTFAEKNYGYGGIVSNETSTGPRIIETTIYAGKKYPSYIAVPVQ